MLEPYETLLSHLKDNPVVSQYLEGDLPEFSHIWTQVMPILSSGEKILFEVALACYNGHGTAKIADIFMLDEENQHRVLDALTIRLGYE
jgi:hypothetical protein